MLSRRLLSLLLALAAVALAKVHERRPAAALLQLWRSNARAKKQLETTGDYSCLHERKSESQRAKLNQGLLGKYSLFIYLSNLVYSFEGAEMEPDNSEWVTVQRQSAQYALCGKAHSTVELSYVTSDHNAKTDAFWSMYKVSPGAGGADYFTVAFKGTASAKDAWQDLKAWADADGLTDGICGGVSKIHHGFLQAYTSVQKELRAAVKKHVPQGAELYLTGHSLGAADATLAAYDMSCNSASFGLERPPSLLTFGAPAVFRDVSVYQKAVPQAQRIRAVAQSVFSDYQDAVVTAAELGGYQQPCDDVFIVEMPPSVCGGSLDFYSKMPSAFLACHATLGAYWNLFSVGFDPGLNAECTAAAMESDVNEQCVDCMLARDLKPIDIHDGLATGRGWCTVDIEKDWHTHGNCFQSGQPWACDDANKETCMSLFPGSWSPPMVASKCVTLAERSKTDKQGYLKFIVDCRKCAQGKKVRDTQCPKDIA